ncbi:MAG: hypothetical protein ABH951_00240 [Patescibacteria group bacterium]
MRKIKVLLVEENYKISSAVKMLLEKIFLEIEIECEFIQAYVFADARRRIEYEAFDLIYLDGCSEHGKTAMLLIWKIKKFNQDATVFLLSTNGFFLMKAKRNMDDPEMCFLKHTKNLDQIISETNLETIKSKFLLKNNS